MPSNPKNAAAGELRVHDIKTWPEFFQAVRRGEKTFEARWDDRAYMEGDTLRLREWSPGSGTYTGESEDRTVTYCLRGGREGKFGVAPGHVVMGLATPPDPAASQGEAGLRMRVLMAALERAEAALSRWWMSDVQDTLAAKDTLAVGMSDAFAFAGMTLEGGDYAFDNGPFDAEGLAPNSTDWPEPAALCAAPVSDTAGEVLMPPEVVSFLDALALTGPNGLTVDQESAHAMAATISDMLVAAPPSPVAGAAEGLTAEEHCNPFHRVPPDNEHQHRVSALLSGFSGGNEDWTTAHTHQVTRMGEALNALDTFDAARRSSTDGQGGAGLTTAARLVVQQAEKFINSDQVAVPEQVMTDLARALGHNDYLRAQRNWAEASIRARQGKPAAGVEGE